MSVWAAGQERPSPPPLVVPTAEQERAVYRMMGVRVGQAVVAATKLDNRGRTYLSIKQSEANGIPTINTQFKEPPTNEEFAAARLDLDAREAEEVAAFRRVQSLNVEFDRQAHASHLSALATARRRLDALMTDLAVPRRPTPQATADGREVDLGKLFVDAMLGMMASGKALGEAVGIQPKAPREGTGPASCTYLEHWEFNRCVLDVLQSCAQASAIDRFYYNCQGY